MNEPIQIEALMISLVGLAVVAAVLINSFSSRLGQPGLVGYMLLGILLRLVDNQWPFLSEPVMIAFRFMANLGIVALLFKVGLESHPSALIKKLPSASLVWIGGVLISAASGFAVSYYLLDISLVTALIVATALTATSVGVSVAIWEHNKSIHSENGDLLVDVAELDDISGVTIMALLFALIPVLLEGNDGFWSVLGVNAGIFLIKFVLFITICLLFVRYIEPSLSRFAARLNQPPERMLLVVGVGFVVASLAGVLGFSLAIGALFAGLIFSGDPEAVKTERSFQDIYAFVTPFFFINIGMSVDPVSVINDFDIGLVLMTVAIIGKIIGHGIPALFVCGGTGAILIAISMVPRAEIALIIMHQGHQLGPTVVPESVYSGMILVSISTCFLVPVILNPMLKQWPQGEARI